MTLNQDGTGMLNGEEYQNRVELKIHVKFLAVLNYFQLEGNRKILVW